MSTIGEIDRLVGSHSYGNEVGHLARTKTDRLHPLEGAQQLRIEKIARKWYVAVADFFLRIFCLPTSQRNYTLITVDGDKILTGTKPVLLERKRIEVQAAKSAYLFAVLEEHAGNLEGLIKKDTKDLVPPMLKKTREIQTIVDSPNLTLEAIEEFKRGHYPTIKKVTNQEEDSDTEEGDVNSKTAMKFPSTLTSKSRKPNVNKGHFSADDILDDLRDDKDTPSPHPSNLFPNKDDSAVRAQQQYCEDVIRNFPNKDDSAVRAQQQYCEDVIRNFLGKYEKKVDELQNGQSVEPASVSVGDHDDYDELVVHAKHLQRLLRDAKEMPGFEPPPSLEERITKFVEHVNTVEVRYLEAE